MRTFRQQCIWSVAVAAFFVGISSSANAAGLFDPASSTDLRAAPQSQSNDGVLRRRLVRLNAAELAQIVPPNADTAANRAARAQALNTALTIDLFPGISVTVNRTDVDDAASGGYAWSGQSDGANKAFVTLIINNGEVLGQIQTGGRLYRIEPVSGAVHQVVEINQDKIKDDIHQKRPPGLPEIKADAAKPLADPRALTTIRIMIAHTVNARKEVGTGAQMQARIDMAVALANTAFKNSGVLIKYVRVGGTNEITFGDMTLYGGAATSANYVNILYDMAGLSNGGANNQQAKFMNLRTKRDTVNADLVVLMRKKGVACGIAFEANLNGTVTPMTDIYGYSVVTSGPSDGCIEGHTLAHETGHNMGMNHDRVQHQADYGVPNPPKTQYNFGFVNSTAKWFTIMAYRSRCNNGVGCTAIPYHSTPLKNYLGKVLGIPQGTNNAADGARLLNENRVTISGYE